MSIWKRIKNLWRLSELESIPNDEMLPLKSRQIRLVKKQATIVDLTPDIELE